jgi:hypothetical protein
MSCQYVLSIRTDSTCDSGLLGTTSIGALIGALTEALMDALLLKEINKDPNRAG